MESVDIEQLTYNVQPYEGFSLTIPFRSTEEGKTTESFSLSIAQFGIPMINGALGGLDYHTEQSIPDEENAYLHGIYAPIEPGEEGQVLNAVEAGHHAPI